MADQKETAEILNQADAAGVFNAKEREQLGGLGLGEKFKRAGQTAAGKARTW